MRLVRVVSLMFALLLVLGMFSVSRAVAANGLTGKYYDENDFTSQKTSRTDATVDFDWGTSIPAGTALTSGDNFSVRWTGQIEPQFSETYTFYVAADDGSRLWIDDKFIAARVEYVSGGANMRGTVKLTAGRRVNIRLEMIEKTGSAFAKLEWSSPSVARQVVPQARLFTDDVDAETGALMKEVWDGVAGTAISQLTGHGNYSNRPLARDFIPSFESFHTNWTDTFGTRVTGFIVPQVSGSYSFAVAGDDIVELYLSTGASEGNKALIASVPSWTAFREWTKFPEQISTTRTLTAGNRYYVELRHVEASGDDHFSVAWKTPGSATWEVIGGDYLVQAGIDRSQPGESSLLDTLATGHPRVLATQERFDWLKAQITANPTGNQAVWYNNKLLPRANAILTEPVNVYDSSDNLDVTRSVLERIYTLALVWQVSGDNQYAERAWDELDAARNFPSWQPSKFLCVAEMTHAFAIGMDWFYHYWSSSRMTSIRNAIVNKGFNPGIAAYDGNEWWTQNDANNWNLVCNGGLVLGVLANGTYDEAKAEKILQRALASARPVLDHYTADNGAWYEGSAYWGYSAQYLVRMLSGMESVLGSDFGYLSSKKGLSESGVVPMHMTGPTESMFNFGDTAVPSCSGLPGAIIVRCVPGFSAISVTTATAAPRRSTFCGMTRAAAIRPWRAWRPMSIFAARPHRLRPRSIRSKQASFGRNGMIPAPRIWPSRADISATTPTATSTLARSFFRPMERTGRSTWARRVIRCRAFSTPRLPPALTAGITIANAPRATTRWSSIPTTARTSGSATIPQSNSGAVRRMATVPSASWTSPGPTTARTKSGVGSGC
jgi:PA14 domain